MANFELVFALEVAQVEGTKNKGTVKSMREGPEFRRIISAPSLPIAEAIANAMLEEEISPTIPARLGQVLSVKRTASPPKIIGFLCDFCVWNRVLYRLHLVIDQKIDNRPTFNGFEYFSPPGSGKTFKVGLKFTRAQQKRLLSILPSLNL